MAAAARKSSQEAVEDLRTALGVVHRFPTASGNIQEAKWEAPVTDTREVAVPGLKSGPRRPDQHAERAADA
jgi:hypothetical protein